MPDAGHAHPFARTVSACRSATWVLLSPTYLRPVRSFSQDAPRVRGRAGFPSWACTPVVLRPGFPPRSSTPKTKTQPQRRPQAGQAFKDGWSPPLPREAVWPWGAVLRRAASRCPLPHAAGTFTPLSEAFTALGRRGAQHKL